MFWKAYSRVFHQPRSQSESYCGGHIHVSSSSQEWSTDQLRNIASGIFHFEHFIEDMIPASRQNNQFCKKNSANSRFLRSCRGNPRKFFEKISDASRGEIWGLMQNDRKVLWNFAHVVKGGTGSIEFRGGRCFRGPQPTKAWVAFAVGYMHLLQGMVRSTSDADRITLMLTFTSPSGSTKCTGVRSTPPKSCMRRSKHPPASSTWTSTSLLDILS